MIGYTARKDRQEGFTLVEVLGAITLGMLLIAGLSMMLKAGYEGVLSSRFISDLDSLRSGAETWLTRTQSPDYSNISAAQLQGFGIFNGLCMSRPAKADTDDPTAATYQACKNLAPAGPYDNSYQLTSGKAAFGEKDSAGVGSPEPGNLTWSPEQGPYGEDDSPDPLDLVVIAGPYGNVGKGFIPQYAFDKAKNVLKAKYLAIGYNSSNGSVWMVVG